ncbi:MAG: hypothetical protein ACE5I3_05560 [Phycisphaerae bacterium]
MVTSSFSMFFDHPPLDRWSAATLSAMRIACAPRYQDASCLRHSAQLPGCDGSSAAAATAAHNKGPTIMVASITYVLRRSPAIIIPPCRRLDCSESGRLALSGCATALEQCVGRVIDPTNSWFASTGLTQPNNLTALMDLPGMV